MDTFKRVFYVRVVLFLLLTNHLFAGDVGKVVGTVVDKENGSPLPGVNVMLVGTSYGAATTETGSFVILNVAPGLYSVKFSYIGYRSVTIEQVRVTSDLTTNLFETKLASEALDGEEVVVIAEKSLIEINATNEVRVVRSEDIQNMNVRGYADVVALQTGVVVDASGDLHIRGGRTDEVGFYVDGVYVNNAFTSGRAGDVPNLSLEEVSFQSGGFGAEYGSANSGIVKTTTKTGGTDLNITVEGIKDFGSPDASVDKPFAYSYGYQLGSFALGGPVPGLNWLRYFLSVEQSSLADASPTNATVPYYTGDLDAAGRPNVGDNYIDANGNTIWDDFIDKDANGVYDEGVDTPAEVYTDLNGNGEYDAPDYKDISADDVEYRWGPKPNNWIEKSSVAGNILIDFQPKFKLPWKLKIGGSSFNSERSNYSHTRSLFDVYSPKSTSNQVGTGDWINRFNKSDNGFQSFYGNLSGAIPAFKNMFFNVQYSHSQDSYKYYDPVFDQSYGQFTYEDGTLSGLEVPFINSGKMYDYTSDPVYQYVVTDSLDNILGVYDYDYWNFDTVDIASQAWAQDTSVYWAWDSTAFWRYNEMRYDDMNYINPLYNGNAKMPTPDLELANYTKAGYTSADGSNYTKRNTSRDAFTGSLTWQYNNHELKAGFEITNSMIRYYRLSRSRSITSYFSVNPPYSGDQDIWKYDWVATDTDSNGIVLDSALSVTMGQDGVLDYTQDDTDSWKDDDYDGDGDSDYDDYFGNYKHQAYASAYAENIGYNITGEEEVNSGQDDARRPNSRAFYLRDKIELNDLVLNLGLRYDYFDPANKIFNPETGGANNIVIDDNNQIAETVYAKDADENGILDPAEYIYWDPTSEDASGRPHRIDAEPRSLISPRVGMAFPISDKTVFHAQYGKYFQQPENNRLFVSYIRFVQNLSQGNFTISANPDLQPQENTQYEIGFKQMVSADVSIDATVFYKQMTGYPQIRNIAARPVGYALYVNGDYGTVKGLSLSLKTRRISNLMLDANYTLQYAGGTGSSAGGNYRIAWQGGNNLTYVSPLDFDQRHTGNLALDYRTGVRSRVPLFGVNMLMRFGSGLPYTPVQVDTEVLTGGISYRPTAAFNSANMPWSMNVDLKVDKGLSFGKYNMKFFVWVKNLLDIRNVSTIYPATGQADNDGWLGTDEGVNWMTNAAFNGNATQEQAANLYNSKLSDPYNWEEPRQVRIGFRIDL
ncbi:MAG: TonB-dependent receptor [Candidatus Marinimicrobia bacterium]|nr:TonB-dependent receptor [Candidatus Neomarinimicrobiota bacterium]